MKSFSQFLQESYIEEELPAGMDRDTFNRLPAESKRKLTGSASAVGKKGQTLTGSASGPAIRSARKGMSGQQAATIGGITAAGTAATLANTSGDNPAKPKLDDRLDSDINPKGKTTRVSSPAKKSTGAAADPFYQFPKKPQKQYGLPKEGPSSRLPGRTLAPAGGTTSKPALPSAGSTAKGGALVKTSTSSPAAKGGALATRTPSAVASIPPIEKVNVSVVSDKPKALSPSSTPKASVGKLPSGPKVKVPSKLGKVGRVAGKVLGPAAAALDVADERSKGSGWVRSLSKGAAVAAGGALGGAAGSVAGPVGSVAGSIGGAELASRAFDTAAGANARERKAMATANRQRQAGTAIKGIGGQTTFSQKKPGGPAFMSTGVGKQRKTVELAKTGVVQRGGQSTAGHLAFKGGKAVYKAGPSAQSLAKTSSNPLERIGRSLFAGAYKKHDTMKAQQALQKARQSDTARNLKLGVKSKPAG